MIFWFGNNPPFQARLRVDIGAKPIAVDMPEMVSTGSCCKPPSSAGHWEGDSPTTEGKIDRGTERYKIRCKGGRGMRRRHHWEVQCVEDFAFFLVTFEHVF